MILDGGAGATDSFWMSLCDLVEDGKWYWAHSGEDLGYDQWDSGEPNDVGKVPQRCVELRCASLFLIKMATS